jgi:hypothetical protein
MVMHFMLSWLEASNGKTLDLEVRLSFFFGPAVYICSCVKVYSSYLCLLYTCRFCVICDSRCGRCWVSDFLW